MTDHAPQIADVHPDVVAEQCDTELNALVGDSDRTIHTLAISTLLKTCRESNVDKLLKDIIASLKDLSDEFKIIVANSTKSLTDRLPGKVRAERCLLRCISCRSPCISLLCLTSVSIHPRVCRLCDARGWRIRVQESFGGFYGVHHAQGRRSCLLDV